VLHDIQTWLYLCNIHTVLSNWLMNQQKSRCQANPKPNMFVLEMQHDSFVREVGLKQTSPWISVIRLSRAAPGFWIPKRRMQRRVKGLSPACGRGRSPQFGPRISCRTLGNSYSPLPIHKATPSPLATSGRGVQPVRSWDVAAKERF